ncbi:MAG: hypothetical protein HYS05_13225 [Acidobacteria bacterium]|nr:hypothetical protein [Acidobacteriota bacterium]
MPAAREITDYLDLIKAEYEEMPGLSLTSGQAQRLFGLDPLKCEALLDTLVATRYLARTTSGTYCRFSDGPSRRGPQRLAPRWVRSES